MKSLTGPVDLALILIYPLIMNATIDSIEFLHANRIFTIFFREDLAFTEVRAILDHLLANHAFDAHLRQEMGWYQVELSHASFEVWVSNLDVVIQRGATS